MSRFVWRPSCGWEALDTRALPRGFVTLHHEGVWTPTTHSFGIIFLHFKALLIACNVMTLGEEQYIPLGPALITNTIINLADINSMPQPN